MGLTDALLLDPAPFEVWVAYRTDGIAGSGTASDPFDGGPGCAAPLNLSALSRDGLTATATLAANHNLNDGERVIITGVTGDGATAWNGTFAIHDVGASFFSYDLANVPDADPEAPLAAWVARVIDVRFDTVMDALPPETTVHLGPTRPGFPFLTRGFAESPSDPNSDFQGWQIKRGQRLVGSGIDTTVLRLIAPDPVGWVATAANCFAVAHALVAGSPPESNPVDHAGVQDLTIDCDQPPAGSGSVAAGAVRLMGNQARIRRVKAIRWGCSGPRTARVFSIITADQSEDAVITTGSGIEDCLAINPAVSCDESTVTVLHVGSRPETPALAEVYGRGPFIRDCVVDGGPAMPSSPEDYSLIGFSMNACRAGVVEGNQFRNLHHGGPGWNLGSAMEVTVRNNLFKNVRHGPYWVPGMDPAPLALASLSRDLASDPTGKTALATTSENHGLQVGERVQINAPGGPAPFAGCFIIRAVPAANQFRYQMSSNPGVATPASATVQKMFGALRLVIERNTIELISTADGLAGIEVADFGGAVSLAPDYGYGDVIVRDNLIRYVDGAFGADYTGSGIKVAGAKLATVRNNLLECVSVSPIEIQRCGAVAWRENRTLDADLIARVDEVTGKPIEEYDAGAEDALVAAFVGGT